MNFNHIIVGQGLSGSLLAMELINRGCAVLVIDDADSANASRAAGGLINPVTGKRLATSWLAAELISFAVKTYCDLSEKWGLLLIKEYEMLDFHLTNDDKRLFAERATQGSPYLRAAGERGAEWNELFRYNYGIGVTAPCYIIDIKSLLLKCAQELKKRACLLEEKMDHKYLHVYSDHITYKDVRAKNIIFCDGVASAANPYFEQLPWSKDKGEALIARIPGLAATALYKQHISILPLEGDLFWIGASHDWKYTDAGPTPAFRKRVEEQLDHWLRLPYEVTSHIAALRPANMERRPFAGLHPLHSAVGILNGMGGKGCSWAPLFAAQLAEHLVNGTALMPAADIARFRGILSK